jgi:hypothetical protein
LPTELAELVNDVLADSVPADPLICALLLGPGNRPHALKSKNRYLYLTIEGVRLSEIDNVNFDCLSFCSPLPDVFAINAEIEPLLMTSGVAVEAHQHVVLVVPCFPNEVKITAFKIRIEKVVLFF